jgi:hypothetical protein
MRREIANTHPVVIARESARPGIPETSVIEPKSRGVLDTRLRGYDSTVWGRTNHVIASEAKQSIAPQKEWIASLRSQ